MARLLDIISKLVGEHNYIVLGVIGEGPEGGGAGNTMMHVQTEEK